ncbi:MAG: cytochrome c maturation protein CcmE [Proteobacteria bacterium]|nr:cytochrome c maturation protein CcmE [Pseudomonadota bacterium]
MLRLPQKSALAKYLITGAVALGGVGFLVKSSIGQANHYMMVDELYKTDLKQWETKAIKVHGFVQDGADAMHSKIVGQVQHRAFILAKGEKKVWIFFDGPVPDTFQANSEVVADGRLVKASSVADRVKGLDFQLDPDVEYVVMATNLMAKCPSKYDGAQINRKQKTFE